MLLSVSSRSKLFEYGTLVRSGGLRVKKGGVSQQMKNNGILVSTYGRRHASDICKNMQKVYTQTSRSVSDAATDQGLHFLTLVTSMAHIFLAV